MARSGEQIDNPIAGLSLIFMKTAADTGGELLEMEATYEPSSVEPVVHFHPRQSEHFEILDGVLHPRIGDSERELHAGDTVDIEAGVPHAMASIAMSSAPPLPRRPCRESSSQCWRRSAGCWAGGLERSQFAVARPNLQVRGGHHSSDRRI